MIDTAQESDAAWAARVDRAYRMQLQAALASDDDVELVRLLTWKARHEATKVRLSLVP